MKKILQLSLFSFLVLASYFFYVNFLKINEQSNIKNKIGIKNDSLSETQNNLIKNLEYRVKFDNKTQYIITADLSEIIYENDIEIIKMQKVTAQFIDQDNFPLIVKADYANYNNSNYNNNDNYNHSNNDNDNDIDNDNDNHDNNDDDNIIT